MLLGEGCEETQEPAGDVLPSQLCSVLDPQHLSAHPKVSVSLSNSPFGARPVPRLNFGIQTCALNLPPPAPSLPERPRQPDGGARAPQRVLRLRCRLRFLFVYFQMF